MTLRENVFCAGFQKHFIPFGFKKIHMAYDEYSLLMKDPQPAQWRADELFGKSTSSGRRSGSTSSSFLPNLSWTPPGTADPVLDVATAVVDALGDIDNFAPDEQ